MTDESYIKLAIEIAKKGMGKVSPNPLVGCIIVKDDRIIGAGFHEKYGEHHAEINALNSANSEVEGSTMYINLEPCSHFGNTPPCVDKIIEKKIKKVVIGTLDMNPIVSGKGIKKLKQAGIDVKVGVLENECAELNKFFFKYITKKIPYISLKAAQTLDGKIADIGGESKWISSLPARRYVHELRSKYDAVLVGSGTVKKDDPNLTVRLTEGRNPKRIIIDTHLKLKTSHKLFTDNRDDNLFILTSRESTEKKRKIKRLEESGARIIYVKKNNNGRINLKEALQQIGRLQISSVLVEGGSEVFTSFIHQKLYDNIFLFLSPKLIGSGMPIVKELGISRIQKSLKYKFENFEKVGDDLLLELAR